ncbi:MAG: methyltransferase [Bacteroidales bacterium]|nr:methyltransferase [Bacteroidales bacterium]
MEGKTTDTTKDIQVNRPEPIVSDIEVVPYKRRMNPQMAIYALLEGDFVLIVDFYSNGLILLRELKRYIKQQYSDKSFQGQRDFRSVYQKLSNKILLDISNNKLTVRKAPEIGWLEKLYPEVSDFALPFPKVQGLNSAWQWYKKGKFIPVLGRKIHPWFGTYFPTRLEHLELFDDWIKKFKGEKKSAIDIGIGSGILSFQMLQHGFEKIIGTDTNPNSIIGLTETIKENKEYSKLTLVHGNLFANCKTLTELIVFNPPWLPTKQNIEGLDEAIYYDSNLFPDFFKEAKENLNPNGKIVLLFSNLAQITKVSESNPIEKEIAEGGRFKKELLLKKTVKPASGKTKRNQNWRSSETVELWVLTHK